MDLSKPRNIAQERWVIVRNFLLKRKDTLHPSSVRIHNSLALFTVTEEATLDSEESVWTNYKIDGRYLPNDCSHTVTVRRPVVGVNQDFQAYDNTGNICLWISEQVMAYYCMRHVEKFNNSSVIELGGGYSCLSGMFLAKYAKLHELVVTDGNERAVTNVHKIVKRNNLTGVEVMQLNWDNSSSLKEHLNKFDYVIAADCTFRDEQRFSLVIAMYDFMKIGGEGMVFSPTRGKTLDDFVMKSKNRFGDENVKVIKNYDEHIWNSHLSKLKSAASYKEDLHYPLYVHIQKKS